MVLNKSLPSEELKGVLKKLLKKYKELKDIIIFGSFVKAKFKPKDIDIALVMEEKKYDIAQKIHSEIISKFDIETHITIVLFKEIYTEPIWKSLVLEGFSIKKDKFLKNIIHIRPVEIFSYHIDKMTPTEKVRFNRGFNEVLKTTNSFKIGAGSVVVPEEKSGKFKDFFSSWEKAEKKIFRAILL